ncbi:GvpL/GvpF family gas vesicle protein [Streptomyces sp. NPDC008238]
MPPATAATYVFAICRHVDEDVLSRLPGITTAPVRALPFEQLDAVVQEVPAAEADRDSWTERLSDPYERDGFPARGSHARGARLFGCCRGPGVHEGFGAGNPEKAGTRRCP